MATVRMFPTQEEMDTMYGKNAYPLGLAPQMRACLGTLVEESEIKDCDALKFFYRDYTWLYSTLKTVEAEEAERIIAVERNFKPDPATVLSSVKLNFDGCMNKHTILKYGIGFITIQEPTGNCQVFCISAFKNLLMFYKTAEVKIILQEISRKYDKRLMLFDINQSFKEKLKDFNVKFCSDYTSTNGTPMMSGIIQVR